MSYVFDIEALRDKRPKKYAVTLEGLKWPGREADDPDPTITLQINQDVRKKESDLRKESEGLEFVNVVKGKGKRQRFEQTSKYIDKRDHYVNQILDMTLENGDPVICDSTGFLPEHDIDLFKAGCIENRKLSKKTLYEVIQRVFDGVVEVEEEEVEDEEKN